MAQRYLDLRFQHRGVSYLLKGDYYDSNPHGKRGTFTEQEVSSTLHLTKEYWILFLNLGFQSFGVGTNPITYNVVFDQERSENGFANNGAMTIGLDLLRENRITLFKQLILHELFHALNFAVQDPFQSQEIFRESGANVASFLCSSEIREEFGVSAGKEYLNKPGNTMWDRTSPGWDNDSFAHGTLWWLYFCDQLSQNPSTRPEAKTDVLRDMLRENGWISGGTIETEYTQGANIKAVGNFLGNGDQQVLFDSERRDRRFALVTINKSMGGKGEMHLRISNSQRWQTNGWRIRAGDKVVGVGDIMGTGRDQIVMKSSNPMNLGILGYGPSTGQWFKTRRKSYTSGPVGGRWGGWKLRKDDEVRAVGNFISSTHKHMVITSRSEPGREYAHIGIIGINDRGEKETKIAIREGGNFGRDGWVYQENDRILGHGDLLGIGRDQFILQRANEEAIGIVGVSSSGAPKTYGTMQLGMRFGGSWKLNRGDEIVLVGRLMSPNRSHMLIKSARSILGIVGFSETGKFETGPVLTVGQKFGSNGWTWAREDQIEGCGAFAALDTQQFLVRNNMDIGMIAIDESGSFTTFDSTKIRPDENGLDKVFSIGDFAGRGHDQILGLRGDYLVVFTYEFHNFRTDPDWLKAFELRGHWRDRFAIGKGNDKFTSTHKYLAQFINEKGDPRSLPEFWRDFTITNRTKELTEAPRELKYSMDFKDRAAPVHSYSYPSGFNRQDSIARWAASYLDVQLKPSSSRVRLRAKVLNAPFKVFWSIIVEGPSKELRRIIKKKENTLNQLITYSEDDKITVVITTTWAKVDVQLTDPEFT